MTILSISNNLIKNTNQEKQKVGEFEKFKMKAVILDELLEFIEERYFGYLMKNTETEPTLSLSKAKKFIK